MFLKIPLHLPNIHGLWQPCSNCRVENLKKMRIRFTNMRLKSVLWVLFLPQQGKTGAPTPVCISHMFADTRTAGGLWRSCAVLWCRSDRLGQGCPIHGHPTSLLLELLSLVIFKWLTAPAPWVLEAWVPPLSTRTVSRNPTRQEKRFSEWFNKICDVSQNSLRFYRTGNHEEFHSNFLSDVTQNTLLAPRNLRQSTNMWPFPQPSQSTSQIASFGC